MNKKRMTKKITSCFLTIVMVLCVVSLPIMAFATEPVELTVSSVTGTAGSDVVVSIVIAADSNLGAGTFLLRYDNSKLTCKSAVAGAVAVNAGATSSINTTYLVDGNYTTINDSYASDNTITAGGSMLNVTFTIKSGWTGTSPVTLTNDGFYNGDTFQPMTCTITDGSVSVPVPKHTITFDANGGTGGTSGLMEEGSALNAPTVTRTGYTFSGWSPEVPSVVPAADATYTAQWTMIPVGLSVTVTKTESNMVVNIQGWESDSQYQIWSYQQITSDYISGTATSANQWVLSQAYTAGSLGTLQGDNSINYTIPNFVSPDKNYTIAVRVADESNTFIQEIRDSYTPADVSEVVITKVLVDNDFSTGYEVKDIEAGSVSIKVIGNGVSGTVYSAIADGTELTAVNTNEFVWDISEMTSGVYNVVLNANNGETSDTQTIQIELYSSDSNITYGSIDSMTVAYENGAISIDPTFSNGSFWYRISEPNGAVIYTSGLLTEGEDYPISSPGTYLVEGYVNRTFVTQIGNAYDDGIFKIINIPRADSEQPTTGGSVTTTGGSVTTTGGSVSTTEAPPISTPEMKLTSNVGLNVQKGDTMVFTAEAGLSSSTLYSFWRNDASGFKLVKDWSTSKTLNWTPGRIGTYTIQARAKGADAGSYEEICSVEVNVTGVGEHKAQVSGLNITLNGTPQSRVPIEVNLSAEGTDANEVLYKLYVSDADMGSRLIGGFSPDSSIIWTPREAGTFTLIGVVNSPSSSGYGDYTQTLTVTVN